MLPYAWIIDNTRWTRRADTYDSLQHALLETARIYRRSLWTNAETRVEAWYESDSVAGVLTDVTYY
jgi:hypothetical protein